MINSLSSRRKLTLSERISNLSAVAWLIVLTVFVSLVSFLLFSISDSYINYLALKPSSIIHGKYLWTLLTHIFVHGNIAHLIVNMFVLFSLGSLCERIIGRKRFVWFYILSGVFAGILSVVLSAFLGNTTLGARIFGSADIFMVGASGAIFAIAGLYVMLLPRLRFMIIFLPFFSLPAFIMVPLMLFVMWIASVIGNWPIGNVAHFGGFLAGILYGFYLKIKYRNKVKKLQKLFR